MKNKLILFVLAATILIWYQLTKVGDEFEISYFIDDTNKLLILE